MAKEWFPALHLDNPSVSNPLAILQSDMWYYLSGITEQGCVGRDSILIKVYNGPEIYVPSAFTPNGDKLNDMFKPTMPGIKQLINLSVYNRWGQLVFHTNVYRTGLEWKFQWKNATIGYLCLEINCR